MKKVIILFTVLMTSMLAFAQQKEQARFHVTYAIYNGEDITEWAIKSKLFTVFYTVNEELYMANYSETNETQSWGVIWELKNESIPETASNYKTDADWAYKRRSAADGPASQSLCRGGRDSRRKGSASGGQKFPAPPRLHIPTG